MRNKTEQIFEGAISVFIKKGLQATTQELADEAGVAEVTLFRKFSTKEKLFIAAIKNILEKEFHSHVLELAKEEETETFFTKVIENRLDVLSKNAELVKMLLSESLRGNLAQDINLPEMIFSSLKTGVEFHFQRKEHPVDADFCARQLAGIFLSYIVLPNERSFNELSSQEKEKVARKHAISVLATI